MSLTRTLFHIAIRGNMTSATRVKNKRICLSKLSEDDYYDAQAFKLAHGYYPQYVASTTKLQHQSPPKPKTVLSNQQSAEEIDYLTEQAIKHAMCFSK